MKALAHKIINLPVSIRFIILTCLYNWGILSLHAQQQQYPIKITNENGKLTAIYSSRDSLQIPKGLRSFNQHVSVKNSSQNVVNGIITLSITTRGSTCEDPNGGALIVASGGTAPYQYTIDGTYWYNTGNFPLLRGGNFTVTVVDAIGQTVSQPFTVPNTNDPPVATILAFQKTSSCTNADGSLTIGASGGTAPYQYSLDDITYQSGNVFSNLNAGLYNCFVKDANGCKSYVNLYNIGYLINDGCNFGFGISPPLIRCGRPGTMDISASGAEGPYTYSIDGVNYQASGIFLITTPGLFKAYFRDVHGNIAILVIYASFICTIHIDFLAVAASCGQADGTLTASASDGTPPYTYSIDGVNYQSSPVFTGLWPGNYYVTAKDAANNSYSMIGTVYDKCPQVTLTETDETCTGNNGTIAATGANGTTPYQFSKDGVNFQNSNIFTGLAAGPYTITIKDGLGFTSTAAITVKYKCFSATATVTNVACGDHNGTITVTATNGTTPYKYSLDGVNFQTSNIFTLLSAGSYTVTAKDNAGLTATTSAVITDAPAPLIAVTETKPSCTNNNGVITIAATGGTAPLSYSINTVNFQPGNIFTGLAAQSYTAVIKDANGCTAALPGNLIIECPAVSTITVPETCGTGNGQVIVTASNAIAPYSYSLDGTNFQTSNIFTNLAAATYTVIVKDANGYINTAIAIVSNNCPQVTATAKDDACNSAIGSITAIGTGGTAPYSFSINGINFSPSNIFNGLIAGTYTVTIKDALGTTNTTAVTIGNITGPQVTAISTAATCLNNDGAIQLNATGGTMPLQYSLDGITYQAMNNFTGVGAATYTIWVKDNYGCKNSINVVVPTDTTLILTAGNAKTICEGNNTILDAASNGTNFSWMPATSVNTPIALNPTVSPGATTTYTITATLGVCIKTASTQVTVLRAPVATATGEATVCYGQNAILTASAAATYTWTPGTYLSNANSQSPTVIRPATTTSYSLTVKDGNGCQSHNTAIVKITVTPAAKVFAGNDTAIVVNEPLQLKAIDINNSGFTSYAWTPAATLNNALLQMPVAVTDHDITYTVTATTAAGCQGTAAITIKVYKGPEIYVPKAFTPNNDGVNDLLAITPIGIKQFGYFVLYNRYGQKIFYTQNPAARWDGKFNGQALPSGTYIWIAQGIDDKGKAIQRKGEVIVLR